MQLLLNQLPTKIFYGTGFAKRTEELAHYFRLSSCHISVGMTPFENTGSFVGTEN